MDVAQDVLVKQTQTVADAEVILIEPGQGALVSLERPDREIRLVDFLALEDVDDGIDRFGLLVEAYIVLDLHRAGHAVVLP